MLVNNLSTWLVALGERAGEQGGTTRRTARRPGAWHTQVCRGVLREVVVAWRVLVEAITHADILKMESELKKSRAKLIFIRNVDV